MNSKPFFITLLALVALHTGCVKDELTVGELSDGTIKELPEITPEIPTRRKCQRKVLYMNVDSMLSTSTFPVVEAELCNCDTIDLRVAELPKAFVLIGIIRNNSPSQFPTKKRLDITKDWWGQLVVADAFGFTEISIPIHVDFDECP